VNHSYKRFDIISASYNPAEIALPYSIQVIRIICIKDLILITGVKLKLYQETR